MRTVKGTHDDEGGKGEEACVCVRVHELGVCLCVCVFRYVP